jgi:hypothetical protein
VRQNKKLIIPSLNIAKKSEVIMPIPESFDLIRRHPRWGELSPIAQSKRRQWWVQDRLATAGIQDPKRRSEIKAQLVENAYYDAPDWQKPTTPLTEGQVAWKGVKGAAGEMLGGALDVGVRTLRTPQQLIANLLEQTVAGFTGYDKPKSALEALTRPFKRTLESTMGKREPTKLTEDEGGFLGTAAKVVTDPLTYVGVGLAPRIRDISRLAKLKKAGVTTPIPPLYGRQAREATKAATILKPGETLGIPPSWVNMTPQQQGLYQQVMRAGRADIEKGQLQRVAETVANASPEEAQSILGALTSGNKNKIRSVIAWTEAPAWKRAPLKPAKAGRVKPPTVGEVSTVEQLNKPGELADVIAAMGD